MAGQPALLLLVPARSSKALEVNNHGAVFQSSNRPPSGIRTEDCYRVVHLEVP